MSEIVVFSSSNSDDREIDEYHDSSPSGSNTNSSSNSSSRGNATNEQYTSGVPKVPLDVFQEEIRTRMAFGSLVGTSTSVPLSPSLSEEETLYSCAVGIPSKIDKKKLTSLKSWYQIPDNHNPRLVIRGEWCSHPRFGVGIYEAYLLEGLRLSLNTFAREILSRLGLGINQLNSNAWRLIVSMQILWKEEFDGYRPLTVDEFLCCYKPSEISQSLGFYQFSVRGSNCRLVKSLPTSDRKWKTKFFFIFEF